MADFVAVLKKTIEGLADNTPELRQRVYAKARQTVTAKLAAIQPPPAQVAVDRQLKALEDAITAVERGFADDGPEDDFDSILAGLETRPAPESRSGPESGSAPEPEAAPSLPPATAFAAPSVPDEQPAAAGDEPPAVDEPARPSAATARSGRLDTPAELDGGQDEELVAVEPAARPIPKLPRADDMEAKAQPQDAAEAAGPARAARRGVSGGLIAAAVALFVFAGAGYGVWLNRDAFADMFGLGGTVVAVDPAQQEPQDPAVEVAGDDVPAPAADDAEEVDIAALDPEPEPEPAAPAAPSAAPAVEKFTQRLMSDGTEIDEGPAGGARAIGEGTTLAAATRPGEAGASDAGNTQAQQAALPVGQKAIFYEERTTLADGTADDGATVWSLVQESPGGDAPAEAAIRGEVTIPSRDLQLRMTIRRNADASLPASHIVEMIFITSGTFEGGGVDNVLRIAFKQSEADAGAPLIGIPAKIADGYFLVALSDNDNERNQNTQLMLRQNWIDVPISYKSGRRALVTMEKGVPGNKVFQDAIRAWQAASSG